MVDHLERIFQVLDIVRCGIKLIAFYNASDCVSASSLVVTLLQHAVGQ